MSVISSLPASGAEHYRTSDLPPSRASDEGGGFLSCPSSVFRLPSSVFRLPACQGSVLRQREQEGAPLAFHALALDPDPAAVSLDDAARYRQAQPDALAVLAPGLVVAIEDVR